MWTEMKEGIESLLSKKILLTPTIVVLFNNFAASLVVGVLIFYAVDILQATEREIGFMFSLGAVGGLLGSLWIPFLRKRYGRGKLYVSCVLIEALSYLILVFAITMSNIIYFTIRQEFTPNHLLGRVAGTLSMLMKQALPFGLFCFWAVGGVSSYFDFVYAFHWAHFIDV